jgi:hypothetical protein
MHGDGFGLHANWIVKLIVVSLLLSNLTSLDTLQTLRGALTGRTFCAVATDWPCRIWYLRSRRVGRSRPELGKT